MHNDLTFITNENGQSLKDRFSTLIKDTRFFDVLVGYFYASGFYALYPSLEKTEKIKILIGISTNKQAYEMLERAKSHKQIREELGEEIKDELEKSENKYQVEEGVLKFLEWLKNGKLEIKAYPTEKIHSKVYIMSFNEDDRDIGRVITGSSNLTQRGLVDNLEFNVELKNPSDYDFAKNKFEELWCDAVDVSDQYIETLQKDSWLREDITPYELYLKFLYEYFRQEINQEDRLDHSYRPENFKELLYQDHAVINAKKIIEEYDGVFLSDVVGLGKTFMGTMLCQELKGKVLVLAPPHLIDEHNEGSWENSFRNFGFRARDYKCRSIGVLEKIIERNEHKDFDIILIDEAHRFRNEGNETYTRLAQICRGKKVILVTATPYNNSPSDLLAQIKLFQPLRNSTIPNLSNLEAFFKKLERNLQGLDRQKDKAEYLNISKENSKLIREKVLKYLMVRRTRKEIQGNYGEDLKKQGMEFPEIAKPDPIFYEFNTREDLVFFKTLERISKEFKYARYTPLLYLKKELRHAESLAQKNMMKFMKMLLVKRLESSFYAFRQSLNRFSLSYKRVIDEWENGNVYVSSKDINKIFDLLDQNDLQGVETLLEAGRAEKYSTNDFQEEYIEYLKSDYQILKEISKMWEDIDRDPKVLTFKEKLAKKETVKNGKSIIFTESKETAQYLAQELEEVFPNQVLLFSGSSSASDRDIVIANFDGNAKNKKDDYKILITTDVLSEGSNLHQANVVINYDIPWNPTRIMQRVGRINRVNTEHKKIYTYTFFPSDQGNDEIKLRECAEAKIASFISLLGSDAQLLTEQEEVEAHSLFNILISKEVIEGESEGESELKYLQEIRKIRDDNSPLFEKIKKLPKKARTGRKYNESQNKLLTYFRKGKLEKFFLVDSGTHIPEELDFLQSVQMLKSHPEEKQIKLDKSFYILLEKNAEMLEKSIHSEEEEFSEKRGSRDNSARLSKILKSREIKRFQGFTEDDDRYIDQVIENLDNGSIPKDLTKKIHAEISTHPEIIINPLKVLYLLKTMLPEDFLISQNSNKKRDHNAPQEIILSEYFAQ